MSVPSNTDTSSQSKKNQHIQNTKKRRIFWPTCDWYPLRDARDIIDFYICGKGLKLPHGCRSFLNYLLDNSMKQKTESGWQVDLKETRWESRASIARFMGRGLVEFSAKDVEKAEARLKKAGLIQTRLIHNSKDAIIGRYISMSEDGVKLFRTMGLKINRESTRTPPPQHGVGVLPQQGRGVLPHQGRGTPPAGEESKESFKVNNHILSKAPLPKLGAPPKDPGLIPISEW